jgi:WD40 repeat protein
VPVDPQIVPAIEKMRLGRGTAAAVTVSPDGAFVAVGGSLGVHVHRMDTLEVAWTGETTAPIFAVAFSPDGTMLASGSLDGTIILWGAGK